MRGFSSLRTRVFVTSALLAVLSIALAIYLVNGRVTGELQQQMEREIAASGAIVQQLETTKSQLFTTTARLIADQPKLKAAAATDDPATVQDILDEYRSQVHSSLLVVTNPHGATLASAGPPAAVTAAIASLRSSRTGAGNSEGTLLPQPDGILQLITVPIAVGLTQPDVLGRLSLGFLFDATLAAELKNVTGSDIAFGMDGKVMATTLPAPDAASIEPLLATQTGPADRMLSTTRFVALPVPLPSNRADGHSDGRRAVVLIVRSKEEQLRVLQTIQSDLAFTAIVAVLLATILSFAVARTVTGPLTAITGKMREVAATGDLTRKITLPESRWQDADARLLATTFNGLTDSVARIQRESAQKERLSSLGRLSTVIAHEVRNPLMIIKASLHTLRRAEPSAPSRDAVLQEAITDIDEEILRLERIVNEVLDFARPIKFDLAPADLNAICRESAVAGSAGTGMHVTVRLDANIGQIVTDAVRLRSALVNLIANACQAVETKTSRSVGASGAHIVPLDPTAVTVATRRDGNRVEVTITDRGGGISREDQPRAFDPYFTTKRGGTGIGLPIAKNIIDGLGGTITMSSVPEGTEVRIDLPSEAAH